MPAHQLFNSSMSESDVKCRPQADIGSVAVLGCFDSCSYPHGGDWLVTERTRNDVLRELAQTDQAAFAQLMRDLEPHPLQRGALLGTPRVLSDFLYFIDSGIVSLVANTRSGNSVEVALVGREGVAGIADALGNQPLPYSLVVQLPGLAYRAPKDLI